MRITTKGRYALRAMIKMALESGDKPLSVKKISEAENLSPIFLEQIFTKLKAYGLIQSIRGAGGGFLLSRSADEITVKDIMEAVEEGIRLSPCCPSVTIPGEECEKLSICSTTRFWNDLNIEIMNFFSKYSLARIIDEYVKVND